MYYQFPQICFKLGLCDLRPSEAVLIIREVLFADLSLKCLLILSSRVMMENCSSSCLMAHTKLIEISDRSLDIQSPHMEDIWPLNISCNHSYELE